MIDLSAKILVAIGSLASVGFGVWHFFVPKAWNWYSYIDASATELVVAVRAINIFFSHCLVLFGLMNAFLVFGDRANKYSVLVVLSATCILWMTRVSLQLIHPQGTINPFLQYSMLILFVFTFLCHAAALALVVANKNFN
jgi:hypothetical protein